MSSRTLKIKFNNDLQHWSSPAGAVFILIAGLFVIHWGSVESLTHYWSNNFTYGHGLLIAPLSLYLLWRKRQQINAAGYSPSYIGAGLFFLLNVIWLPAYLIDVEIIQQFDLLAMIAVLCLALLGWRTTYRLSFPLLFPLIAMPLWSWLEPVLQYFTTHVVAFGLSLVGVPIFVETHFIRIPEGEFSIEEVCAGLRYLLAAVAISLVYAHMYMKKISSALLFLIFSVVLSLVVNWIRVYSVIVAGHLTNMQHSLVHDHATFGWWLFAATLIPIFWFGNFLLNKEQTRYPGFNSSDANAGFARSSKRGGHVSYVVLSLLVIAAIFPASGYYLKSQAKAISTISPQIAVAPSASVHWQGPLDASQDNLRPKFQGADTRVSASYHNNGQTVFFYTANYMYQEQGKELISWDNSLFDQSLWNIESTSVRQIKLNSKNKWLTIDENVVRNPLGKTRVLWSWYSVAGVNTVKPVIAKVSIIKDLVAKHKSGSRVVLLASDSNASVEQARAILLDYLNEAHGIPGLE